MAKKVVARSIWKKPKSQDTLHKSDLLDVLKHECDTDSPITVLIDGDKELIGELIIDEFGVVHIVPLEDTTREVWVGDPNDPLRGNRPMA